MATRPTINNAYRVLLNFALDDVFMGQTHMDFIIPSFPFDFTSCTDLVTMIGGHIASDNVNDALSTRVSIPIWTVQNFDDPTKADIDIPSTLTGTESGDILPENVAALVSLRTVLAGRSNRGRAYWPGYTEASADGSEFDPTSAGQLAIFYSDVVTAIDSDFSGSMAVLSIKNATAHVVSAIIVEPSFATMRKRLSRVRV